MISLEFLNDIQSMLNSDSRKVNVFTAKINIIMLVEGGQRNPDSESVLPQVHRRKTNEQTIIDSVVIFSSLLIFMSFGLLLETNLHGWAEPEQKKTAFISFITLCIFALMFCLYFYSRTKKTIRRCFRQHNETLQNVSCNCAGT